MFNNKNYIVMIALILVVALSAGCVNKYFDTAVIVKGDKVTVDYTGSFDDGTIFDTSANKDPLTFTVGSGQLIKGFDDAVMGMKVSDAKNIVISPEDAYGNYDKTLLIDVPINDFVQSNLTPTVGMSVVIAGQSAIIKSINAANVTIDFNHPLAGQTLHFNIKIIKIEK